MDENEHSNTPAIPEGAPVQLREPIAYKGVRVLTTELAARAFGVDEAQLRKNHERNRDRFENGKHYFLIEGEALRELKDSMSLRHSVGRNARSLILWTERGVARHAKILDTDTAWEIFEKLEDTYFRVREEASIPVTPQIQRASASELRLSHAYWSKVAREAGLDKNQALFTASRFVQRLTEVNPMLEMGIKAIAAPSDETMLIPKDIGTRLGGVSSREVNKLLTEDGYHSPYRTASGRLEYELTDKGKEAGGRKFDAGRQHSDGTIVPQIKWPASIVEKLRETKH